MAGQNITDRALIAALKTRLELAEEKICKLTDANITLTRHVATLEARTSDNIIARRKFPCKEEIQEILFERSGEISDGLYLELMDALVGK
jgi:hypothetical protein